VSLSSGEVSQVARIPAGFEGLSGVALDGDALYVTNEFEAVVEKVTLADGRFSIVAGTAGEPGSGDGIGLGAHFTAPTGILSDGHGRLYVADDFALRRIEIGTFAVTTLPVTFTPDDADPEAQTPFIRPTGLALDGAGNLYVADTFNNVVRRVDLATNVVTKVAGRVRVAGAADGKGGEARFNSPQGLALDGGILYVADGGNGLVRTIDLASGAVETVLGEPGVNGLKPGPLPARLNQPTGLALFSGGRLVISDRPENVLLLARFGQ
jgi:DNA-binding beta-propeller fold protein YncE